MKKIFLIIALFLSNSLSYANEMNNPCVYHPNLPGCAGNNRTIGQSNRVVNIPDRWGAIYLNPANVAIGYAENNTEGYRSANKEALANCITAGGGKNPRGKSGKGCQLITQYRNTCGAIAIGGVVGNGGYGTSTDMDVRRAEKGALLECSKHSNECTIRYSGCSRHPDYLRY